MRLRCLVFSLPLVVLLAGCVPKIPVPPAASPPAVYKPDDPTVPTTQTKPAPVGVVIAFPVAAKSAQDFASGIGFYLSDAVAGAPEFGQTPLRTTVYEVVDEYGLDNVNLPPKVAEPVARACGATHYGTGTYTEERGNVTLRYELRRVDSPESTPIASAVSAPSRSALLQKLPEFARQLRASLGAGDSEIQVAPLAGMTPGDLAIIGACANARHFTDRQKAFLRSTGKRVPLAAELALFIFSEKDDPAYIAPYTKLLWKSQRVNTQTLGRIAGSVPQQITLDAGAMASVYALAEKYPDSSPLAQAAAKVARYNRDWNGETQFAARSPQNAPGNPDAHMTAGTSLSLTLQRIELSWKIRKPDAKTREKLLPLYRKRIEPIYAGWQAETEAATQCDPLHKEAYLRLVSVAAFRQDGAAADAAMTTARKIKTDSLGTYSLALELYQSPWGKNPDRLRAVAEEAATAHYDSRDDALAIGRLLGRAGFADLEKKMRGQQGTSAR